jgi:UDP-glucose 4-epimerase
LDCIITGGCGFIGQNLAKHLNSYVILDKAHPQSPTDISFSIPPFIADTLFHLASFTDVRKSIQTPVICIDENIQSMLNCLEHLRSGYVKKLVFTSSIGSANPSSPYTASKSACNALCTAYSASYNLNIVTLYLANIYGPHSVNKSSVIASFIKNILKNKPITIYGSGKQTRDFVYVSDCVTHIISSHKSTNVCTGRQVSINQIVKILNNLSSTYLHYTVPVIYKDSIKGEIHSLSTHQTIEHPVSIEEGLELTFKWFLENYNA